MHLVFIYWAKILFVKQQLKINQGQMEPGIICLLVLSLTLARKKEL